jgi:hypothetical protein
MHKLMGGYLCVSPVRPGRQTSVGEVLWLVLLQLFVKVGLEVFKGEGKV